LCQACADDGDAANAASGEAAGAGVGASGAGGSASAGGGPSSTGAGAGGPGCDRGQPFGPPVRLTELSTDDDEVFPRLTPDELTIVFARNEQLYLATRATASDPFGEPSHVESAGGALAPSLSSDGLTMYSSSLLAGALGALQVATRASVDVEFAQPMELGLDTDGDEGHPFLTADDGELWFVADAASSQVWRAPVDADGTVGSTTPVDELDDSFILWAPTPTADGLELYVARGATDNYDIHVARRASRSETFGPLEPVTELSQEGILNREVPGWTTPDGCRIYFSSSAGDGSTAQDLYRADKP
jgi:hypothetical protein